MVVHNVGELKELLEIYDDNLPICGANATRMDLLVLVFYAEPEDGEEPFFPQLVFSVD